MIALLGVCVMTTVVQSALQIVMTKIHRAAVHEVQHDNSDETDQRREDFLETLNTRMNE